MSAVALQGWTFNSIATHGWQSFTTIPITPETTLTFIADEEETLEFIAGDKNN